MASPVFRSLLLLLAVSLAGCYKQVEIKPTEAPKLNGSYARETGSVTTPSGTVKTVEKTVAHLEKPDGTLTEITGAFDAVITTTRGRYTFEHPVNAELKDRALLLRGANRPATEIPLAEVQHFEVSQPDPLATSFVVAGVALVASVLVIVAVASSSSE